MYTLTVCLLSACCVPISSLIYSGDKTDPVPGLGAVSLLGRFSWHCQRQDWNSGKWSIGSGTSGLGVEKPCSSVLMESFKSRLSLLKGC